MQTETTLSIDWNVADEVDDYWRWYNLQNCGKPKWVLNPTTGEPEISHFRHCNYAECPKCQARKKKQETTRLNRIDRSKTKYVEVDEEEEKRLTRKYGKDKVRRIPLDGGKTGFLIETDDTIEGEQRFTDEIAQRLVENIVRSDNRRPSGNLGKVNTPPVVDEQPDKEVIEDNPLEIDWETPDPIVDIVEVRVKECTASFDSDNPDAPKDVIELFTMMQSEVDIECNPTDHRELWDGVKKMEDKIEEICARYNMSFRCIKILQKEINLFDVDWKFTRNKGKPE